jgi:hypothetical protein
MTNLRKLIGILVVLFVVLFLAQMLTDRRGPTVERGGFESLVDPSLDMGSIDVIRGWLAASPDTTVQLRREGEGWVVASAHDWPARDDRVETLLDQLEGLSGEKRSSSADVLDDYQIGEENGFHLVAETAQGAEIVHLVVGKNAGGGEFVREEGSNDVYLTRAGFRNSFGVWGESPTLNERQWVNTEVVKIDAGEIDRVALRSDGSEIVLERQFETLPPSSGDDEEGVDLGGEAGLDRNQYTYAPDAAGPFDKAAADRIVRTVSSLHAYDVADPDSVDAYGLGDDADVVEIQMIDGTEHVIRFGEVTDDERQYFMREGGKPARIHKGTPERVFVDRATLSPKEEAAESAG